MSRGTIKDVSITSDEITLIKGLLVSHMLVTKQQIDRLTHLGYDQFVKTAQKDFDTARELMNVLSN